MVVIWRDISYLRIFFIFLCLISLAYAIVTVAQNPTINFFLNITFSTSIFYIFILIFTFNLFRMKLCYIANQGIRIGNTPDTHYIAFKLKQKPRFFRWKEIDYLKIVGRRVWRAFGGRYNVLILKTKSGKKYECLIARPQKFINKLSEINKKNLFKKDSKFF